MNATTDSGSDPFETISDFFQSGTWDFVIRFLQLFAVALWAALIYWTYQDARRRIHAPGLIALCVALSLVLPYLGSLIYLIVRPPEYLDEARERELELLALERRLGEIGDDEGQELVGRLLSREGLGDRSGPRQALQQAGAALQDDLRALEARVSDIEYRLRGATNAQGGVADPADRTPDDPPRRSRVWRDRQKQDAHD